MGKRYWILFGICQAVGVLCVAGGLNWSETTRQAIFASHLLPVTTVILGLILIFPGDLVVAAVATHLPVEIVVVVVVGLNACVWSIPRWFLSSNQTRFRFPPKEVRTNDDSIDRTIRSPKE
jgi:hypothetical protein